LLLVFDIGNTQIAVGVFQASKLTANWHLWTDRGKTPDEYGILLKNLFRDVGLNSVDITAAIISSVVPPVTGTIEKMIAKYFEVEVLLVGPGVKTGLSIKYENPREIGADRVVNAVAGINLYGYPLIIVDFGTAITFCAISETGDYLGGAIAPGVAIASEALFRSTAKLPRVELAKPRTIIGKNTISGMQAGLYYGYVGLIEGLINRIKQEMNCRPKVIATGDSAGVFTSEIKLIEIENPYLTLEGLKFIYELNRRTDA